MRPQPLSFTVTAFSRFSCRSTPAPPVNKPASQPSQPVSLPDNNNNCTGNFKGSHGIATFVVIFPSRFQWRERKHGCDVWSFIWSFEFNSLSGILELRYSILYLPVFSSGTLVVPLITVFQLTSHLMVLRKSLLFPPRPPQTCL